MSILRKLRRWCPQPKTRVPANFARLSTSILIGAVLVEIVALLIAPMAYFALFPPHVNYGYQTFPLSNSQIAASWPNLPTANQIVQSAGYLGIGGAAFPVKNYTQTGFFIDGGFWLSAWGPPPTVNPFTYVIWLQCNGTWIRVPANYLATNNPPSIPAVQPSFLGTGLPTTYAILVVISIVATLTVGTTYLILHKKAF